MKNKNRICSKCRESIPYKEGFQIYNWFEDKSRKKFKKIWKDLNEKVFCWNCYKENFIKENLEFHKEYRQLAYIEGRIEMISEFLEREVNDLKDEFKSLKKILFFLKSRYKKKKKEIMCK